MDNQQGSIWLDGDFVPWQEAKVHVLNHTLHYGMGIFEGIRAYETTNGAAIFRLEDHINRLLSSAHILNMPLPYDKQTILEACLDSIKENNLKSAYIRPMCFYSSKKMGLHSNDLKAHVMVAAWNWDSYLGNEGMEKGIRVKTSSFTRHHVNVTMCKAKTNGNYVNSMLALQEANRDGYDEALLLDCDGYIAEGSGENIFIVREGVLYTPEPTSALEGITRDTIIQFSKDNNLVVKERRITRDEVYIANEAFFTGTAAEVTPIRELDGRQIGNGNRGTITQMLQKLYFQCVGGKLKQYEQWLSLVK